EAKPAQHRLDVSAGPGGLQDIDLFAQAGTLLAGGHDRALVSQIETSVSGLSLEPAEAEVLVAAQSLYWTVRTATRLVFGQGIGGEIETGAAGLLVRVTGMESLDAVESRLSELRACVAEIVMRHLPD
ncbi:MAG: hypothetical protein LJE62_05940, partial [Silicimonas sp.]|nr:hypothetical protein [Silicimonas sp.]